MKNTKALGEAIGRPRMCPPAQKYLKRSCEMNYPTNKPNVVIINILMGKIVFLG